MGESRGMRGAGAAVLIAGLAGGARGGDGHALEGVWIGQWKEGTRQEVRIDGMRGDGRAEGTFCGVRPGDGSAFWFDLDEVDTREAEGVIEIRRGGDLLRFARESNDTVRYEIERGGKIHRLRLTAPSPSRPARCLPRVRRAGEAKARGARPAGEAPAPAGVWSYQGEGRHQIGIEIRALERGGYAGTVCWRRRDRSNVFYDFAPGARNDAKAVPQGLVIERRPFKATIRHRVTIDEEGTARWSQQIQRRPWEGGHALARGAPRSSCLARLAPAPGVR